MTNQSEHDRKSLEDRRTALRLPVAPLRRHGFIRPDLPGDWQHTPDAVGVGPDGTAYAVWAPRLGTGPRQVTWHVPGRRRVIGSVTVPTALRVSFVQPLPGGRLVLAAARAVPRGARNAEVWTEAGELLHHGYLGDAIEDLLTTPAGLIWASYFDEAMADPGPGSHGLARFHGDLSVDWLYPKDAGLPFITDCYALNLVDETAHLYIYTAYHLLSVSGSGVTDHGALLPGFAGGLLHRDGRVALIGGSRPEYDVVRIPQPDGPGARCRLVLPDGLEATGLRLSCRGPELHAFQRQTWLHLTLDDLLAAAPTP